MAPSRKFWAYVFYWTRYYRLAPCGYKRRVCSALFPLFNHQLFTPPKHQHILIIYYYFIKTSRVLLLVFCDVIISEHNTGCVHDQDPSFKIGNQDLKAWINTIPPILDYFLLVPKSLIQGWVLILRFFQRIINPDWISSEHCCSAPLAKNSVTLRGSNCACTFSYFAV